MKFTSSITKKIAQDAMKDTVGKCRWCLYQPVIPEKVQKMYKK